jgi:hypothetical protein
MFNRGIALAATAALALAGAAAGPSISTYGYSDPSPRPSRQRKPLSARKLKRLRRYHARGSTKKTGAFRYKGSKRAKRATRLGGNPARH